MKGCAGRLDVVKAFNNPQGRRLLINEWVATTILRHLDPSTPETTIVELDSGFLEASRAHLTIADRQLGIQPGLHLATEYDGGEVALPFLMS